MTTRSGIPLTEIAPDAPDLRTAVAAVLENADRMVGSFDSLVRADLVTALRAAYDATPEPAPAISEEERTAIGRARNMCYFWAEIRGVDSPEYHADMAVLARIANRGK